MVTTGRGYSLGQCIRIQNAGIKKLNQANRLQTQGTHQVQMAQAGFQRLNKQQGGGGTRASLTGSKQQRRTQRGARGATSSGRLANTG